MSSRRKAAAVLERESKVWARTQAGYTQDQIATELGIEQGNVSRILERIQSRVLMQLTGSVESHKIQQTARLEWIYAESMRAWEQSKTPRKRAIRRTGGGDGGEDGEALETREAVDRDGDTNFLHCGMAALRDIRSLWGLDVAPALQEPASSIAAIALDMVNRG